MAKGGYDYHFVDTPSDMLLCKICHFPSREPHLSVCCGHTFCKSCLDGMKQVTTFDYWGSAFRQVPCPMCRSEDFTTVANKQNERVIKSLRVLCTNKDKGCDWQGEINDITGHLERSNGCLFEEVKCSNNCGLLLQRQHLHNHVDNECPYREVHCQYCSVVARYQFIEGEHVKQCPKFPLPCPNNCGMENIFREDMEAHKTTCPLEKIKCPNDCGEVLQRQSMGNHVETECPLRQIDCQYCQLSGEYHLIEGQHKEECPKLPMCCPNECDAGNIPQEDMEGHRQKCPLEVVQCEYYSVGCHATMVRKDLHIHEREKMEEHLLLTKCEFLLTKSELINTKVDYKTKINVLESELQRSQTKINELESETHKNVAKVNKLQTELQQNHAVMKILFGEWTMLLNTRAVQLSSGDQVLPVVVRMSEYTKKKENNDDWYSDPFYTHEEGCRIQLKVVPGGQNNAKDTHLSVYLNLMLSTADDNISKLPQFLNGKIKVTLLNQIGDIGHHSVAHNINSAGCSNVIDWDGTYLLKQIWCYPRFIKTTTLLSSEYLKNDSLFFEVSKFYY